MGFIAYCLALPFIYLVSILPFPVMYALSTVVYVLLYRVIGYRRQIVLTNLRNAFPDKDEREVRRICSAFYVYFCDFMFETVKLLTITTKGVYRHVDFTDLPLFEKYAAQNQNVIVAMGHLGNWEFAGARFSAEDIHDFCAIYKPLKNKYFDKLLLHSRTRHGSVMYKMKQAFRKMLANRDELTATIFLADQTPPPRSPWYWTTFLNQDTPMFTGIEQVGRKFNYPVIYLAPVRVRRGHFDIRAELLVEHPADLEEYQIIERYIARLEQDIHQYPEQWLWTHRRWKRKRALEKTTF